MTGDPYLDRLQKAILGQLRRLAMVRARSYRQVFMREGRIDRHSEIVLADLRDHCFATKSTFHVDPYEAARRQGRREAWLRITQHLNLDEARVQKLVELDDEND